jgi:DNA invertase Pin-like site-specific DNA recombinase
MTRSPGRTGRSRQARQRLSPGADYDGGTVRLESELAANIEAIVAAIPKAIEASISFDAIAKLVGVSRQTLYRWQEVTRRLKE